MSEKELDYTAFDPADCRMPEQVYACREIEGGKHKYYQIGMKILYKPALVKYAHFCPEKLKHLSEKEIVFNNNNGNERASIDKTFSLSIGKRCYKNKDQIDFDALCMQMTVNMRPNREPIFFDFTLEKSSHPHGQEAVCFSDVEAARKDNRLFGNKYIHLQNFHHSYKEMTACKDNYLYRVRNGESNGFAGEATSGITALLKRGLVRHLLEQGARGKALSYYSPEQKVYANDLSDFLKRNSGLGITAPHRRVVDSVNLLQVIAWSDKPDLPCYEDSTLEEFANILSENKASMGVLNSQNQYGRISIARP